MSENTGHGHCCTPETHPNCGQQVTQFPLPLPSIRLASVLHPREMGTALVSLLMSDSKRPSPAMFHIKTICSLSCDRASLGFPPAARLLPGHWEHCEYLGERQGAGCARSSAENGPVTGSIMMVMGSSKLLSRLPLLLAKMFKMAKQEKYITLGDHPKITV